MAASQGFVGGKTSWGSPFSTRALQQHKAGWGGGVSGDGLVAWSWEGAPSLTPHHLLPRLSEDRGMVRVQGGVSERVRREYTRISARTHLLVCQWVGGWVD